jgi:hypothetical protein
MPLSLQTHTLALKSFSLIMPPKQIYQYNVFILV